MSVDLPRSRATEPGLSRFVAVALSAWFVAACATRQAVSSPSHRPSTPQIGAFDNTLLEGVETGCAYERRPLSTEADSPASADVRSLIQQNTRTWTATLSWGEAADARGTTELTLSFADIVSTAELTPRRDPALKGGLEMECVRYTELLGTLHVQTRDGRWDAKFPAALRAHSTGDKIATMSDRPLQFFGVPWSSSVDREERAILFTELTTTGAAGTLIARSDDGVDHVAASWR